MKTDAPLLTRAEVTERRRAVGNERELARASELNLGFAVFATVIVLLGMLFAGWRFAWAALLSAAWTARVALHRLRLEPRKRRAGYICPACRGTFPTDADDFRLVLRGGRCLRCAEPVLSDPELPPGTRHLPPMTALGEQ
jgi:hypothetical protein